MKDRCWRFKGKLDNGQYYVDSEVSENDERNEEEYCDGIPEGRCKHCKW